MIERIDDCAYAAAMHMEDAIPTLLQTSRTAADAVAKMELLERLAREIGALAAAARLPQ